MAKAATELEQGKYCYMDRCIEVEGSLVARKETLLDTRPRVATIQKAKVGWVIWPSKINVADKELLRMS